jgi:hypothetical protein
MLWLLPVVRSSDFVRAIKLDRKLGSISDHVWGRVFHVALLVACFWLRRAEEHDLAWCVTLTPNPMFVLGVALAARVVAQHNSSFGVLSLRSILTIIWIVSVAASVFWTSNVRLEADEVDFSLKYAGLINCAALGIPLECFLTD